MKTIEYIKKDHLSNHFRLLYASKHAFKITFVVVFVLIVYLFFGLDKENDFLWYGLFSAVINLMFYPYQRPWHEKMIERFFGVSAACASMYLLVMSFRNWSLLFAILLPLSFYLGYKVGEGHRYRYGFILWIIYLNICVVSWISAPSDYLAPIIHLPLGIAVALFALFISDLIIPENLAYRNCQRFYQEVLNRLIQQLEDIEKSLISERDIADLIFLIEESKNQYSSWEYTKTSHAAELLRRFTYKFEVINQQFSNLEQSEIDLLSHAFKLFADELKSFVSGNGPKKLESQAGYQYLKTLAAVKRNTYFSFCLHELILMQEDIQQLLPSENQSTLLSNKPPIKKKQHSLNKEAIIYSAKLLVCIFASSFFILWYNVPGQFEALVAAIVVTSMPNAGGGLNKLVYRFFGASLGGFLGLIVFLLVGKFNSFLLLLGSLIATIYLLTYYGMREFRTSISGKAYAYTQACLIFIIILFYSGSPIINLKEGIERFLGVFFGGLIGSIVIFFISPKLPKPNLEAAWHKYMVYFSSLLSYFQHSAPSLFRNKALEKIDDNLKTYKVNFFEHRFLSEPSLVSPLSIDVLDGLLQQARRIQRSLDYIQTRYYRHALQMLFQPYQALFSNLTQKHFSGSHIKTLNIPILPSLDLFLRKRQKDEQKSRNAFIKIYFCMQEITRYLNQLQEDHKNGF